MILFLVAVFLVAILAGATASLAGFGIGSLLTPLLAARVGVAAAVAAVAVPHAVATFVRCWRLRRGIEWDVLRRFGLISAAGGLAGALLFATLSNRAITGVLAGLLLATAAAGLTGWTTRWHPHGITVPLLGAASGFFGGIAGNQGGLRAAALLAFGLTPVQYIATSTAVGALVDVARMPIYLWRAGGTLYALMLPMAVATAGVLVGTILGERILLGMSPERFRLVISVLIGLLGVWLLVEALQGGGV